jgi:RNA polymerase sigma-70 factor (ECF subfamily)
MELEMLVRRFQKKDVIAFEKLYDMYIDNIRGVIQSVVRNREISEELAQDVFVKIWDNSASYNSSKGRFFTWILNIARNAAIDKVRSKGYKDQKKNLTADYFVGILEQTDGNEETIDTTVLRKLLMNLKKKCIQVIEMLYFRGYTQKQASEELEIPLGTVKTRNRNCIGKLRENMTLEWK